MAKLQLLRLIKYYLHLETPYTQTTESEMNVITRYASTSAQAIEIGVYEGVNTVAISKAMPESGKLFGIDPFFKGKLGICYYKYITRLNLSRNKVSKKVNLVEKLSFDAINDVPKEVDFIFIDGDHSYEGLKKDWEIYSQKVAKGGHIALHDTSVPAFDPSRAYLGSIAFFKEVISKDDRFEKLETVDSLNILRRK